MRSVSASSFTLPIPLRDPGISAIFLLFSCLRLRLFLYLFSERNGLSRRARFVSECHEKRHREIRAPQRSRTLEILPYNQCPTVTVEVPSSKLMERQTIGETEFS